MQKLPAISIEAASMKPKKYRAFGYMLIFFSGALFFSPLLVFAAGDDSLLLQRLLERANSNPDEALPKDSIYFEDGFAYCTGQSEMALENNRAAQKMKAGGFQIAVPQLEEALKKSSLFFPFRYNLGMCYLHLSDFKKALLNFTKAQAVVPEYYGTYLQIGEVYHRMNRDREAIDYYREALKKNKKELNTYVLIGDIYLHRNQVQAAKKYYDECLAINSRFPNGLLGRAKIHFRQGEYHKALVLLKSIDTSGEYDKSLHYYFAECAYKLRDYATASRHYEILLRHKNDKFFITNSIVLIEHKLSLSNRFIEK
jgi:tetratricopeptide (TPR) repeat protein